MNYESKTAGSWLSNHGYNTVLKSAAKLDERRWYVENIEELKELRDSTKAVLLAEQYQTESILRASGLNRNTNSVEIPEINTVQNPSPFSKRTKVRRNFHIDFFGMPRSGKETLIAQINSLANPRIVCTLEPYTTLKKLAEFPKEGGLDQQQYILASIFGEFIMGEVKLRQRKIEKRGIIIHNRSFVDNPIFTRARLLYGDIPIEDYYHPEEGWIFRATTDADAVIILMQPPEVSMQRKTYQDGSERHINPEFLGILYEQYLRAIISLKNKRQKNLAIIDSSGKFEVNFQNLRTVLSQIIGESL